MEITVTWIFGAIVSASAFFMSHSYKRFIDELKDGKKENAERFEKLENNMVEKYVLKTDYHREIDRLEAKLDLVKEELAKLNKSVAELIGKLSK